MNEPKVSVIVPAYNAEATIEDCVKSLLALDWPTDSLELVLVDDGSTDGTRGIIRSYPQVRLVEAKHEGPAAARNLGVKSSKGDVIIFTDSDCVVPKDWLKRVAAELDSVDAVGGSMKPSSERSLAERFEQARRERLYGRARKFVTELPSCNLAFKRGVFEEAGGFDEEFRNASAEDYDLCRKVTLKGHKILYEPGIEIVHHHSQTLGRIFRRAYLHGSEIIRYKRKMGKSMAHEMARTAVKTVALPVIVLMRYPLGLAPLGLAYEALTVAGNVRGFIRLLRGG
ncbi:MAG: glycosyltransferase [Candidatus Altiarchaeota archaeon]